MSDSLRPHELQHARPPCPSPTPRVGDAIQPSHPLLLLPPIPPNIRHQVPEVPSDEPKQKSLHEALKWGMGQNRNQAPPTAVYLGFKWLKFRDFWRRSLRNLKQKQRTEHLPECSGNHICHPSNQSASAQQGQPPTSRGDAQNQDFASGSPALTPASILTLGSQLHLLCSPWEKVHGRNSVAMTS